MYAQEEMKIWKSKISPYRTIYQEKNWFFLTHNHVSEKDSNFQQQQLSTISKKHLDKLLTSQIQA